MSSSLLSCSILYLNNFFNDLSYARCETIIPNLGVWEQLYK